MKRYSLIILALLIISSIKSQQLCDDESFIPKSAKECYTLEPFKEKADYCCYVYIKMTDGNSRAICMSATDEEYREKNEQIEKMKRTNPSISDMELICNSSYFLKLSISIILLFIF